MRTFLARNSALSMLPNPEPICPLRPPLFTTIANLAALVVTRNLRKNTGENVDNPGPSFFVGMASPAAFRASLIWPSWRPSWKSQTSNLKQGWNPTFARAMDLRNSRSDCS
jgi:hypothetical protein